jgi:SAM-dependent methyltransferase
VLVERCGLRPGTCTLEIGPGTGQATRRLLELGAKPLFVVEPNGALADYVETAFGDDVEVMRVALENAELGLGRFDLAAAASSFHWVEERAGLARIFLALRPSGWISLWWTLFGEGDRPDPFMAATKPLLEDLEASPARGESGRPAHALDVERRKAALQIAGFDDARHELFRWSASWDTAGIRALYGSFSPVLRLDDVRRNELLDEIALIAERDFGGRVERVLTTSLHTARRPV